jgi:hypothetical protein
MHDDPALVERIRRAQIPHVHVIAGSKIGGCASDAQSVFAPAVPEDWRFLGQLTATFPPMRVPFPVFAHPRAVDLDADAASYRRLMHGPGDGVLCLYLDGAGRVQIHFSCA